MRVLALILTLVAAPVAAEEILAGLSQSRIAITTNFDGSELLIFGAIKREEPIIGDPLQLVITVEGPSEEVVVRRKARRLGIWVNTDTVKVDTAPSFYAVATSASWAQVITDVEDLRHHISTPRAIRLVGAQIEGSEAFAEALIRIRTNEELYQTNIGAVTFDEQTLFSTSVRLPANLHEGDYRARFFLTRNGQVVDQMSTDIDVRKVGLERFLFRLSRDKPLLYGLMSLAIAIGAGWTASAAFRMFQR